jgi:hypothetical protein
MTTRDQTRVVLDLVSSREPISGHLRDEAGAVRSFDGWLELAELLAALSLGMRTTRFTDRGDAP